MKDKINGLDPEKAKKVLAEILNVYLDKGFGVMNKTEIEILLYHVLRTNGLLSGKCFDDSFALQITEAKARKLIYESQIKYSERDKDALLLHLRKSVGKCLTRAYFSNNNKTIKFAIEDKYLRIALSAYLREHDYFADTSFNTDIVSIDENAFAKIVPILVPNYQVEDVLANVNVDAIQQETKAKEGESFWSSLTKDLMVEGSLEGIKQIGNWMIQWAPAVVAVAL